MPLRISLLARVLEGVSARGTAATLFLSEDQGKTWQELKHFTPDPEHQLNVMWFNYRLQGKKSERRTGPAEDDLVRRRIGQTRGKQFDAFCSSEPQSAANKPRLERRPAGSECGPHIVAWSRRPHV